MSFFIDKKSIKKPFSLLLVMKKAVLLILKIGKINALI
jgi:hypothetical protein